MPHPKYHRKGHDLIYEHKITLLDALCAKPFEIETLDHRKISVPLDEIVNPTTKKYVEGEGMPIYFNLPRVMMKEYSGEERSKGNLWIIFDIEFPGEIDEKGKLKLKELFTQ